MDKLILGKDDKPITITLRDEGNEPVVYADLIDLEIVLAVNNVRVAVYRITPDVEAGELEVLPVDGEPDMCKYIITATQQAIWPTGRLQMQMTMVSDGDADFTEGRKTSQVADMYFCVKSL